jgi:tetratricopeptide (TPR) repeat protein
MTPLNFDEIQKIAPLLLSPDDNNVQLALSLLETHRYALPKIKDAVLIFALFNPEEKKVARWIAKDFPALDLKMHPVYPLAAALFEYNYAHHLPQEKDLKQLIEAQAPYEKYIASNLKWAEAYEQFARQIKTRYPNNYSLVLPYFRKARKYFPNSYSAAFSLAHSLHYNPSPFEKIENYAIEVLEGYAKAYETYPLAKALYAIAVFYHDHVKDAIKAEHYYQLCIKNHPSYPFAYNGWAELLLGQNQAQKAKKMALQGLAKLTSDEEKEHLFDTLGHIEWKGFQNYEQAAFYFSRAIEINPLHWESIIGAAEMFFEINDYNKANDWYIVALNRQPKNLEVLKQLALIQESLKNLALAKDYYNKILAIIPNFPLATEALERLNS